jgi:anti-sigma factor RsiW
MNEIFDDEALDRRLREAVPYIDDAGFTARVIAKLPPPQARRSWRAIILFALALIGSGAAYVLSDGGRFITVDLARAAMLPPLWLLAVTIGCGMLAMSLGLVAAVTQVRQLNHR